MSPVEDNYAPLSVAAARSTDSLQDELTIAVMGLTGTGKSSFIKLITEDPSIKIGNSLEPETSEVHRYPFVYCGRKGILVDTPGFDDSRTGLNDAEILSRITNFLLEKYDEKRKLNGFIYLQPVNITRMGKQSTTTLRRFKALCGTPTYKNVVVLTTFWDKVQRDEGVEKEAQLKSKFFQDIIEGGACFMRHDQTLESARQVLSYIYTLVPTHPQIAREIREEKKKLVDTAAGSIHREELDRIRVQHEKEMEALKAEMRATTEKEDSLRRALQEEINELKQQMTRRAEECLVLQRGLEEKLGKNEASRIQQERDWNAKFDSQAKAHRDAVEGMKAEQRARDLAKQAEERARELERRAEEKRRAEEAERRRAEIAESQRQEQRARELEREIEETKRAKQDEARELDREIKKKKRRAREAERRAEIAESQLQDEHDKSYMRRGLDLADAVPLVPGIIGKPVLGAAGVFLDIFGAK